MSRHDICVETSCKRASEGESLNPFKIEEQESRSEYSQVVTNLLNVLNTKSNSSDFSTLVSTPENIENMKSEFNQNKMEVKSEGLMSKQTLNQPKVEPSVAAFKTETSSSKDSLRVRVFKCLEKIQKMLANKAKYSTKDRETCLKLKTMLQLNPDLTENELQRLEVVIEKKVKIELDEIDLKIVEEKCALEDKRLADMERKCDKNDNSPTLYNLQQVASNSNGTQISNNDELAPFEKLSIGSDSYKQLSSNYQHQSNYFVSSHNNNQEPKSSQQITQGLSHEISQSTFQKQMSDISPSFSSDQHQGQLLNESALQGLENALITMGQFQPQSSASGLNSLTTSKPIVTQSQTQSKITHEEKSQLAPKKIYTVPKQASLNNSFSTSLTSESSQIGQSLEVQAKPQLAHQNNVQLQQMVQTINQKQIQQQLAQQPHQPIHRQLPSSAQLSQEQLSQQQPSLVNQDRAKQTQILKPQALLWSHLTEQENSQLRPPPPPLIHRPQLQANQNQNITTIDLTTQEETKPQKSFNATNEWRRDAREALIKSMLQIEQEAYFNSQSQENYLDYFQDIFKYAKRSITQINEKQKTQVQALKSRTLEELQILLNNEPPRVVESVTREWKEIDSEINNMVNKMKLDDVKADQPFKNINLLPDDFEVSINKWIDSCRNRID